jgi:hypothetical protein
VFQRNIQFLEDYLRADKQEVSPASRDTALAYVSATPGLPLDDLVQLTKDTVTTDESGRRLRTLAKRTRV